MLRRQHVGEVLLFLHRMSSHQGGTSVFFSELILFTQEILVGISVVAVIHDHVHVHTCIA